MNLTNMKKIYKPLVSTCLVTATLGLIACGGDSSTTKPTTYIPSPASAPVGSSLNALSRVIAVDGATRVDGRTPSPIDARVHLLQGGWWDLSNSNSGFFIVGEAIYNVTTSPCVVSASTESTSDALAKVAALTTSSFIYGYSTHTAAYAKDTIGALQQCVVDAGHATSAEQTDAISGGSAISPNTDTIRLVDNSTVSFTFTAEQQPAAIFVQFGDADEYFVVPYSALKANSDGSYEIKFYGPTTSSAVPQVINQLLNGKITVQAYYGFASAQELLASNFPGSDVNTNWSAPVVVNLIALPMGISEPASGHFGLKVYKPTGVCNPDRTSTITGLDGSPVEMILPGGVAGTITSYHYNSEEKSVQKYTYINPQYSDAVIDLLDSTVSGSDENGNYIWSEYPPSQRTDSPDVFETASPINIFRIDWNLYPDSGSFPTECFRSGSAYIDFDGQLKNIVVDWADGDDPGTDPVGVRHTLTFTGAFAALSSEEYVLDLRGSSNTEEGDFYIWRIGEPESQIGAAQVEIIRQDGGESLSAYAYEGQGFSGLWVNIGEPYSASACALSGELYGLPSCASLGVTVDKAAGTITFDGTPVHGWGLNDMETGTWSGVLSLSSP